MRSHCEGRGLPGMTKCRTGGTKMQGKETHLPGRTGDEVPGRSLGHREVPLRPPIDEEGQLVCSSCPLRSSCCRQGTQGPPVDLIPGSHDLCRNLGPAQE